MSPPPKPFLSAAGAGKAPPEKSKFAQTCNRLSLFLKDKGNIRDLNAKFGVSETSPATVDLLSTIDDRGDKAAQYVNLDSAEDPTDKAPSEPVAKPKPKPKTAQMTIFYQGQVLVLDDVPPERARDLMLIAKNGKIEDRVETTKPSPDNSGSKEPMKAEVTAKDSDLPIARRASLHKFLAKRKDRATVRAPYQSPPGASSSGNEHSFDLNM